MISHPIDNPCSPAKADIRNFLKKSVARRALSELGPNDPKANMRMAESLITITAEQFMKKWNFDPIRFKPIPSDRPRYLWTQVKTKKIKQTNQPSSSDEILPSTTSALDERLCGHLSTIDYCTTTNTLSDHSRLAVLEAAQRSPSSSESPSAMPLHRTPTKNKKKSCRRKESTGGGASVTSTTLTPKARQCKITAYGRQRKRLHSTSKTEEGGETEVIISPSKRLALSPSKL